MTLWTLEAKDAIILPNCESQVFSPLLNSMTLLQMDGQRRGKVIWMNEAYPPDVTDILMDTEEDSDSDEALDGESDSDYDSD